MPKITVAVVIDLMHLDRPREGEPGMVQPSDETPSTTPQAPAGLDRLGEAYNAVARGLAAFAEARDILEEDYSAMFARGAYSLHETHARQMAVVSLAQAVRVAGDAQQHINQAVYWLGRQQSGQNTRWT
jgi:hypothetical protein